MDEVLLDHVPQERTRYTSLGGAILGTATIAAFSMWFAISQVLGFRHPLVLVPALLWGLIVLNIDRWLVSSALGSGWHRRLPMLLTRLLLALVIGVIVAEPLVLRVFETAIEEHVRAERVEARDERRSLLLACNPGDREPDAPTPPGCVGHLLTFQATPASVRQELEARREDAQQLRDVVDKDTEQHEEWEDLARRECVGAPGDGLTEVFGEGPNCRRLREQADTFHETHRIAENVARLGTLEEEISALEGDLAGASERFERDRAEQVAAELAQLPHPRDRIGFLERLEALHVLASQGAALGISTWAVRLFIVVIDCLPVLIKMLGGTTTYDRLVDRQLRAGEKRHDIALATFQRELDAQHTKQHAEIDLAAREHAAWLDIRREEAIAQLARQRAESAAQTYPAPDAAGGAESAAARTGVNGRES